MLKTIEEIIEQNKKDAPKFKEEHVQSPQTDFYYLEDRDTLKKSIEARTLLNKLDILIKNSSIREAVILSLMKLEAQFSSSKEKLNATFTEISEFQSIGESDNDDAAKVSDNNYAIKHLRDLLVRGHKVNTEMAHKLCRIIEGSEVVFEDGNYIGDKKTGRVDYLPPKYKHGFMIDWENFLQLESDLDELILMAISHYQLESIHPFPDGNGRTGRMLNQAVVCYKGLSSDVFVPMSRLIAEQPTEYSELLSNVTTEGDWKSFVVFMLESVIYGAEFAISMAKEIEELYFHICSVFEESIKRDREKIIFIMEKPVCTTAEMSLELGITTKTARKFLNKASDKGLLKSIPLDGNVNSYYNVLLIKLIEKR